MTTDISAPETADHLEISDIDRWLHEPARLFIAAHLYSNGSADLPSLLRQTGLTWGNLTAHVGKLNKAGYVSVRKEASRRTTLRLTDKGREAFESYWKNVRKIFDGLANERRRGGAETEMRTVFPRPETGFVARSPLPARPQVIEILRKSALFSTLDQGQLMELSHLAVARSVAAEHFLYSQGDILDGFYVLSEGMFKVLSHSPWGKDFIIAFMGQGDVFGNITLLSGIPSPTSAQAITQSKVLVIKNNDLQSFVRRHPELSFEILRQMLNLIGLRSADAAKRLGNLAAETADRRLANTLFALSSKFGPHLPFTRETLAQMSGTSTETAIRFVSRLKQANIVRSANGKLIILDSTRLALLGEGLPPAPNKLNHE